MRINFFFLKNPQSTNLKILLQAYKILDKQVQVETTQNHNFWMEQHKIISKEKKSGYSI